jgi:hypothetical protein
MARGLASCEQPANDRTAPSPAEASEVKIERHGRGVGELER